ncbi:MAG: PQQ-dependent sugar dehydrogenase [Planctomycetes bacterium]|nr:PQQ-dependent sugar dehydrogenase [Planctomycetota bacterium]
MRHHLLAAVMLVAASMGAEEGQRYQPVSPWPSLTFTKPLCIAHPPDLSDTLYLIEQTGRIRYFHQGEKNPQAVTALDITAKVNSSGNEEGMLALAFHPKFASDRRVFIYYCLDKPRRTRLSSFLADAKDPASFDPASERVLLEIDQPYSNHNGGMLLFDRKGLLYLSIGDGGSGGDPHDNGQSLKTLLAKIIRIDIDKTDGARPYGIPADNPFVGIGGARPEIWAYGLRNVWRMSFDRATGDLWAGDVGQNKWEEVDVIIKGGNYGWNAREGKHVFKDGVTAQKAIEPILEYPRDAGQSITGGYVYRGKRLPELVATYIYGDFASGRIWGATVANGKLSTNREIARAGAISSFGEDRDGEIYFTSFDGHVYTLAKP